MAASYWLLLVRVCANDKAGRQLRKAELAANDDADDAWSRRQRITHHARDFDFDFARRTLAGIKHGPTIVSPTSANAVLDLDRQPWSNDAASSLVQCGTHSTVCVRARVPSLSSSVYQPVVLRTHAHTFITLIPRLHPTAYIQFKVSGASIVVISSRQQAGLLSCLNSF